MTVTQPAIRDNIAGVQDVIADACARSNRNKSDVTLVAVSKTHPAEYILTAMEAGLTHFGENRVGESMVKVPEINQQVDKQATWHFVGHIQSRKARDVAPLFQVIHSIDRMKIAHKLSDLGEEIQHIMSVLVEINISGEEAKYGFEASNWKTNPKVKEALWQAMREITALPHIKVSGLMTMAPFYDNMEQTRPVFADLAELRDELQSDLDIALPDLSMGMTNDYPVAIEEGATIIRVGRAIFGERH